LVKLFVNLILLLFFLFRFNGKYKRLKTENLGNREAEALSPDTEEKDLRHYHIKQDPSNDFDTSGIEKGFIKGTQDDKIETTTELDNTPMELYDTVDSIHTNPNATVYAPSDTSKPERKSSIGSINQIVPTIDATETKKKKKKKKKKKNNLLETEDSEDLN